MRTRRRGFIAGRLEAEREAALARKRSARPSLAGTEAAAKAPETAGHRHGRARQLMGTFGPMTVHVPRARLEAPDGKTAAW